MKTMAKQHKHQAIPQKAMDRCWDHCVAACCARPEREVAHGNITRTDVCRCGATRESEINAGRTNYGPWEEALHGGDGEN